jgi:CelD/BcsL family acetyltransferase involved in cellulose biosynthesis
MEKLMASTSYIAEIGFVDTLSSEIEVQVVGSETGLKKLYAEWRELQIGHGRFPFTDANLIEAWWNTQGKQNNEKLHIFTLRHQGRLIALAPLAVVKRHGIRFLQWAGGDLFDYCDSIAQDEAVNALLWRSVQTAGGFDVALLRSVYPDTSTHQFMSRFAKRLRTSTTYAVTVNGASSHGWKERLLKSKFRQKARKLESRGPVQFEVVTHGTVPNAVLSALVRQKSEWAAQRGKFGLFDDPAKADVVLRGIVAALAAAGTLHLSWLRCGDDIIAVQLACVRDLKLYLYMPSYELSWSNLSPGQYLLSKILEWSTNNGLEEVDFLRGGDDYKASVADIRRTFGDFAFAGSVMGRIVVTAMCGLHSVYASLPSALQKVARGVLREGVAHGKKERSTTRLR